MKRTILFVALFAFIAASAFLGSGNFKNKLISKAEEESADDNDRGEFAEAAAYLNKLRANEATGTINLNDYYQARIDANYYTQHPANRGGLGLQWQEMGPDNIGGRTRSILFDRFKQGRVYSGAVSGGLWVSQDEGASWNKVPGFDNFGSLTVSCLAQGDDSSIYFGTGESFAYLPGVASVSGAAGFPGDGIWKSSNQGQSWTQIAAVVQNNNVPNNDAYSFINRLASGGASYPGRMYAAINSSSTKTGIQYWDGAKWNNVKGLPGGTNPGYDVEVGSDGVVHAVVGTKYYRSTDGVNFKVLTIPGAAGINRLEVTVSTQDPNYVYALSSYYAAGSSYGEIQGVYKSTDGGLTWTRIAPEGISGSPNWEPVTQGVYALAISVWPSDKNVVVIGGIDCYKGTADASQSLGYIWAKISNWTLSPTANLYVHADIHKFSFDPFNPNIMFVGCDGGMSYTTNFNSSAPSFSTRNHGFNATQFYGCAAKPFTGEVLAGAQDNGNIYIDFKGNTVQTGKLVKGGDGGDVALSSKNPDAMFAEYVNGSLQRSSNNGGVFSGFYDCNIDYNPAKSSVDVKGNPINICGGDGMPDEGAPFISPILLWENKNLTSDTKFDTSEFFIGTNNSVWMTPGALDFGGSPVWFRLYSSTTGAVIALATSADGNTVYGGTDGGALYRITGLRLKPGKLKYDSLNHFVPDSAGIKTTLLQTFTGVAGRVITGVAVDQQNPNHVVVTLGNYGNTDYVYETDSALGLNPVFTSIQGTGLPKMPVYSVIIDKHNSKNIVIGTELGIYATGDGGNTWSEENNGLNRIPVFKLRAVPVGGQEDVIYASSYGRGVFRTSTLAYTGVDNVQPQEVKGVNLYPNPATNEVFVSVLLPSTGTTVELNVFDLAGKKIKTIEAGKMAPGYQLIKIPTNDLVNGTYFLNIRTENGQTNKKFLILK